MLYVLTYEAKGFRGAEVLHMYTFWYIDTQSADR